jgi:hypothetical protein
MRHAKQMAVTPKGSSSVALGLLQASADWRPPGLPASTVLVAAVLCHRLLAKVDTQLRLSQHLGQKCRQSMLAAWQSPVCVAACVWRSVHSVKVGSRFRICLHIGGFCHSLSQASLSSCFNGVACSRRHGARQRISEHLTVCFDVPHGISRSSLLLQAWATV